MHHNNIGLSPAKPTWQLILPRNVRSKVSAMTLVLTVVGEPTALSWKGAYEVDVGDAGILELTPQQCPPTALFLASSDTVPHGGGGRTPRLTGLPVMESPSGMILILAWPTTVHGQTTASARKTMDLK